MLVDAYARGTILLEGVSDHSNTQIQVCDYRNRVLAQGLTSSNGSFVVPFKALSSWVFRIIAIPARPTHLWGYRVRYFPRGGSTIDLEDTLPGGDATASQAINIDDLTAVIAQLGQVADTPYSAAWHADINHDGTVDATDQAIVEANMGKTVGLNAWL